MKRIILLLVLVFAGCGITVPVNNSVEKLSLIELRMSKEKVKTAIGDPNEVRGSIVNEDNDVVTVWQYNLYAADASTRNFIAGFLTATISWWVPLTSTDSYWLYFVENQLAQWGRAGDWREDFIMKIKLDE